MSRLQDVSYCAGYIETCLQETSPEPGLLKLVLNDVAEALVEKSLTSEEFQQLLAQLDDILSKTGQEVIYNLANWLKSLGLKLSVNIENPLKIINTSSEKMGFIHQLLSEQNIDFSIRLTAAQSYQIKLENEQEVSALVELLTDNSIEYPIRIEIAGGCLIQLKDQKAQFTFINLLADSNIEYSIRMRLAKSLANNKVQFSHFMSRDYQLT